MFALVALVPFAPAALGETIDFESVTPGTILDSVNGDEGTGPIYVKGFHPQCRIYDPWNTAVVFDSSNPPGIDFDLGTPNETFDGPGIGEAGEMGMPFENAIAQGHILIVNECDRFVDRNEDGQIDTVDSPVTQTNDADVLGSSLEFDFSAVGPVTVDSIRLIDVEADEPSAQVQFFDGSDGLISMVTLTQVGDNGTATFDLGMTSNVTRMVVTLNGSGAIDNIVFGPPAPSCGDGNIDPGETCDPPGLPEGEPNECRDDCTYCGDGNIDTSAGEQCDDGNNMDGDGCDATCQIETPSCGDGNIDPGETCDPPGQPEGEPSECRDDCTYCGDMNIDTGEECDDGNNEPNDGCDPYCNLEGGGEGCTPGYYKQPQHFCEWAYDPDDSFDDVFMVDAPGDDTLLEALSDGGGGETAFQRHAVAALLNASGDRVDYLYSPEDVKNFVQQAYMTGDFEHLKNMLEEQNEAGCPLGNCFPFPRLRKAR